MKHFTTKASTVKTNDKQSAKFLRVDPLANQQFTRSTRLIHKYVLLGNNK